MGLLLPTTCLRARDSRIRARCTVSVLPTLLRALLLISLLLTPPAQSDRPSGAGDRGMGYRLGWLPYWRSEDDVQSRGLHRLRLLLAAMPLLAGVYAAYEATSPGLEPSTFVIELARRLPLALILAIAVYCLVSIVSAILLRLHRVSIAAQAERNEVKRPRSWRLIR
jgi:hypothetical protein